MNTLIDNDTLKMDSINYEGLAIGSEINNLRNTVISPRGTEETYLLDASEQAILDVNAAKDLEKKIPIKLNREFLIKTLPPKKVTVTRDVKVETGEIDESTGALIYNVEQKEESIDNPLAEGIILALPTIKDPNLEVEYIIGEHVLFFPKTATMCYWFHDSVMVGQYNIIGKIKPSFVKPVEETESK